MELTFQEHTIEYLDEQVFSDLCQELTGELAIPDTMPEVRRILDCFGIVLVRSRSAEAGGLTVTGEVRSGVLYVPESEEGVERVDLVLPFTVTKNLQAQPDSGLFCWCWLQGIDARCINSRKVLVRADLCCELTLLTPQTLALPQLTQLPAGLECRTDAYPMTLPLCWAEKDVSVTDELPLPEQLGPVTRVLKWDVCTEVSESRILGEKAVFKGNFLLRCLLERPDGTVFSWQHALPWSQFAELDREIENGILTIQPILRHAELDTDGQSESRRLLLDLAATAQLLARGPVEVSLTEDAYYLCGELEPEWQTVPLRPLLDARSLPRSIDLDLPPEVPELLDYSLWTRTPEVCSEEGVVQIRVPATVGMLWYDADRRLQSRRVSLQPALTLPGQGTALVHLRPAGESTMPARQLRIPAALELLMFQAEPMRQLAGGRLRPQPRTERPSLLVKRCEGTLWQIAKEQGSTVEAIRRANALDTDEVEFGTMLLIPLGRLPQTEEEQ